MPFPMTAVQHSDQKAGDIATILLAHYHKNARVLPWRAAPGMKLPDPYHVWLSEIMLQQTTVAAVIPYFRKFTSRWPDFATLAATDQVDVMAEWAGLGYYARARNLVACAKVVAEKYDNRLPRSEAELLKLPGIGAYTAAAIAAIAYGKRAVVVDANVERVVARLFAIGTPLPAGKAEIRAATDAITPNDAAGDFAQAMMDLGAGICSVRNPSCMICPIVTYCVAGQAGMAEAYPVKPAKKAKPHRTGTAYWIEQDDHVWLVQRSSTGMLGGMRALPDDGWSAKSNGNQVAPFEAEWRELPIKVTHVFTHFTLILTVAVTALPPNEGRLGAGEYWPVKSLDNAGLPTLFSKVVKAVRETYGQPR
jgi:A/G-specific adenine glycosylase